MKIKIENAVIDIKLSNDDLLTLRDDGIIKSETPFPTRTLFAYLEVKELKEIQADFNEEGMLIYLPAEFLEELKSSFKLGFKANYKGLLIVIEKEKVEKLRS